MNGNIHIQTNPKISHDLAEFIASRFPKMLVNPTKDINTIMYEAGQQNVIAYIRSLVSSNATGDIDINKLIRE